MLLLYKSYAYRWLLPIESEWKPVVGHIAGEGHVTYILMYNMLSGIRVAVSYVGFFY